MTGLFEADRRVVIVGLGMWLLEVEAEERSITELKMHSVAEVRSITSFVEAGRRPKKELTMLRLSWLSSEGLGSVRSRIVETVSKLISQSSLETLLLHRDLEEPI